MTGDNEAALVIAVVSFLGAAGGYLRSHKINRKVDDNTARIDDDIEECKRQRNECRQENDDLKTCLSALETQIVYMGKMLPGGEWANLLPHPPPPPPPPPLPSPQTNDTSPSSST